MRALRDFNIPKIVADDLDIFYGLLGDLFPGIDVPRKRDHKFEDIIKQAANEMNFYEDPEFILKVVQLSELLEIRHCVFVMGNPGSGKSSTWKTLAKA
jgi:dynein heavy chain